MAICPNCGENVTPKTDKRRVYFHVFQGSSFTSWESLFSQAAELATEIGTDNLIGISHSEDQDQAVVTVWYWE